jgi:hypothetical protein
MYVTLLMLVVLFACIATLYADGLWSNAIRLVYVVTAALLATNFYEPLAARLEKWQPSYTYVLDFVSLWLLFVVFAVILRVLTDFLSRVKVRFLKIVDRIGSALLSLWIGWVMVCFTLTTLHTAPLARNFLGGDFAPEKRMVMGLAPDRQWLGFTQQMSRGPYAWSSSGEKTLFDREGCFMPKYASRRNDFERNMKATHKIRIRPGD